jgi:hypothetical protein
MEFRIVSMSQKNGTVRHLVNPHILEQGKSFSVQETSTFLPENPPAKMSGPKYVIVTHVILDEIHVKPITERFEWADAFCVSSSIDIFNHKLPYSLT